MTRYFELYEKRQCAELDLVAGSPAALAPTSEFDAFFKTPVREIEKSEYKRLCQKYTARLRYDCDDAPLKKEVAE